MEERLVTARGRIFVDVPKLGLRMCYLGTQHMDMRFQGQGETVDYGNLSRKYDHSIHSLAVVIKSTNYRRCSWYSSPWKQYSMSTVYSGKCFEE